MAQSSEIVEQDNQIARKYMKKEDEEDCVRSE